MILHPAHDHVRNAVLASLDAESRAGWHEALARAFEAVQGPDQLDSAGRGRALARRRPPRERGAPRGVRRAAGRGGVRVPPRRRALRDRARRSGRGTPPASATCCAARPTPCSAPGSSTRPPRSTPTPRSCSPTATRSTCERLHVEVLLRRGRLDEALPAAERLLAKVGIRIPLAGRTPRTRLATQWMQVKLRGLDYVERDASAIPAQELLHDRRPVLDLVEPGVRGSRARSGRAVRAGARRARRRRAGAGLPRARPGGLLRGGGRQPQPRGGRGGGGAAQVGRRCASRTPTSSAWPTPRSGSPRT